MVSSAKKLQREKQVRKSVVRGEEIKGLWEAMLKVPEFQKIVIKHGLLGGDKAISEIIKSTKRHKIGIHPETIHEKRAGGFAGKANVLTKAEVNKKIRREMMRDYFTKEYIEIKEKNPKMTKRKASEIIGKRVGFEWETIRKLIKVKEEQKGFPQQAYDAMSESKKSSSSINAFEARGLLTAFNKVPEMKKMKKEKGLQKVDKATGKILEVSGKTVERYRLGQIGNVKILNELERGYDFRGEKMTKLLPKKLRKRLSFEAHNLLLGGISAEKTGFELKRILRETNLSVSEKQDLIKKVIEKELKEL